MRHTLIVLLLLVCVITTQAQSYTLKGAVMDTVASAIPFTTISVLNPADSTLAYFGISNSEGQFTIKDVNKGKYLLQVAFMGFRTYYKMIEVPVGDNNLGQIILRPVNKQLKEVQVIAEKIPLTIKGDTVEYNAGSFKTKPDANVEELLKKLPGVQVDKAGNIKAQGEGVNKVLVDGKPFFSDDPKVATKNLPADAINKVQVFNKHSDMSEFTGIDDGSREKTINLQLKDDKKNGYFGDIHAGYGTNNRFDAGAKLYQFKPKTQLAAIGMLNNINHFGFTFSDYINFSGGLRGLMGGGSGLNLGGKITPPVDFGQPIYGLITSGAGGINYSYEPEHNKRINVSYLGNGSDKTLNETSTSENFINTGTYTRNSESNAKSRDIAHRVNLNVRRDADSSSQLSANASASLTTGHSNSSAYTASLLQNMVINNLDSRIYDKGNSLNANGYLSYLINTKSKKQVYKASVTASYQKELTNSEWTNITNLIPTSKMITDMQKQANNSMSLQYSGNLSLVQSLGKGYFLEPGINAGNDVQHFTRKQTITSLNDQVVDSLSPDFSRNYTWLRPGVGIKKSTRKVQFNFTVNAEAGILSSRLGSRDTGSNSFVYVLPSFFWQNEYAAGKHWGFRYSSKVNAPSAVQLMPVADYSNPLQVYRGSNNLRPEYEHDAGINWLWFDQFSFSSLFANVSGQYTADKITWARTINPDLSQSLTPVNTARGYNARGRIEYSRPIPKTGITVSTSFEETYDNSINIVNNVNNNMSSFNHHFELSFGNKKKEKWDISIGGSISITDARYSVDRNLNNSFKSLTGFGEISYRPSDHWYFMASADITQYNAASFSSAILIPLVKAEASFYFLKANRGTLTIEGFDLLNRNTGLQRVSQLNYLSETRSNIIGQYFMLSFKYRLNKAGNNKNAINIKM